MPHRTEVDTEARRHPAGRLQRRQQGLGDAQALGVLAAQHVRAGQFGRELGVLTRLHQVVVLGPRRLEQCDHLGHAPDGTEGQPVLDDRLQDTPAIPHLARQLERLPRVLEGLSGEPGIQARVTGRRVQLHAFCGLGRHLQGALQEAGGLNERPQ